MCRPSRTLAYALLLAAFIVGSASANRRPTRDLDDEPMLDLDDPEPSDEMDENGLLNLDVLDLDEVPEPALFELPLTVRGEKLHCGYWEGHDPDQTAKDFGKEHNLSAKQIAKLGQALGAEAARRKSITADFPEPPPPPPAYERKFVDASKSYGLARLAGLDHRVAAGQIAIINFYNSRFCEKMCTQKNGLVILSGVLIMMINCAWAASRYRTRRKQIAKNIARRDKENEEKRVYQEKMVEECLSQEERATFQGALKGHLINTRKRRQAASEARSETGFGWSNWAAWGNGQTENPFQRGRTRV